MTAKTRTVKPRRPYDGSQRREQAVRNRDRIVEAARQRFLLDGYAATTVASIADDANVSVDTIYKAFGGKPGLVRAIRTKALEGDGPVPAEQRSDALHTRDLDGREIIAAWSELTTEVAPRVAPILLLVRAAAGNDPQVAELLSEMDSDRHRRMRGNAKRLRDGGHLRPGVTLAQATDVLWTYSAPELYELLVLRLGWSAQRYGRFIADAMIDALVDSR